jgi:uncharacterized membrane protein YgcG
VRAADENRIHSRRPHGGGCCGWRHVSYFLQAKGETMTWEQANAERRRRGLPALTYQQYSRATSEHARRDDTDNTLVPFLIGYSIASSEPASSSSAASDPAPDVGGGSFGGGGASGDF